MRDDSVKALSVPQTTECADRLLCCDELPCARCPTLRLVEARHKIEPIETTTISDCMFENLPSPSKPKKRPAMPGAGRPKGSITIADRSMRLQMAAAAARYFPDCVKFWGETVNNDKAPFEERHAAAHALMDRAFGKPPQAIEGHFTEARKRVLEVRWMPPDPNDRSKLIEPEPD
jgi:hypothetical protein